MEVTEYAGLLILVSIFLYARRIHMISGLTCRKQYSDSRGLFPWDTVLMIQIANYKGMLPL